MSRSRCLPLLFVLAAASSPVIAASYYVASDVPIDLGGTTYLPWQVLRRDDPGGYAQALALPAFTAVDGVHRLSGGFWYLSVRAPTDLGGTTFDPRDVFKFDGFNYSTFFCGAAAGVPDGSNVDALFISAANTLVLSFDVPTTIGGNTYDAADLVEFASIAPGCGNWSAVGTFFDASATVPPIPPSTNVTGADVVAGQTIVTFDVPTDLGASTFFPGQLVSWNGASFSEFAADPSWTISAHVADFSIAGAVTAPGIVPPTIMLAKTSFGGANVRLTWTTTCGPYYGIYEGVVGNWYSHSQIDCFGNGGDGHSHVFAPAAGNRYYLVVPRNVDLEGSYGKRSNGVDRPVGTQVCSPQQLIGACP